MMDVQAAPLLLPTDPSGTAFEGYLTLGDHAPGDPGAPPAALWLRLTGVAPPRPGGGGRPLAAARLEVCPALAALLGPRADAAAARLADSPSPAAYVRELRALAAYAPPGAAPAAGGAAAAADGRGAGFYAALKAELDAVGWARVAALARDLTTVTLCAADAAGRRHALELALPPGFPAAPPAVARADLPLPFELRWPAGAAAAAAARGGLLAAALAQFEAELARHQPLWDSLDDLDAAVAVIEPPPPRPRGVAHRRLALGGHASLAVALDPAAPRGYPASLSLMGPDAAVAPARAALAAARARWRSDATLRENLEAALGAPLPGPRAAAAAAGGGGGPGAESLAAECAICYQYRLPPAPDGDAAMAVDGGADGGGSEGGGAGGAAAGEAPDAACDNPACGKPFHRRCLGEWLAADTTARRSLRTLFGACPYCSAPISVRL